MLTIAEDVLPNTDHTQAAISVHSCHPVTPGGPTMVPSPAAPLLRTVHALQCFVSGDDSAVFTVLSLVTLNFDLDIQTRLSEGPNTSSL